MSNVESEALIHWQALMNRLESAAAQGRTLKLDRLDAYVLAVALKDSIDDAKEGNF